MKHENEFGGEVETDPREAFIRAGIFTEAELKSWVNVEWKGAIWRVAGFRWTDSEDRRGGGPYIRVFQPTDDNVGDWPRDEIPLSAFGEGRAKKITK